MGVGAGLYMCDVVKKSSRSLSHLLMSSCILDFHCNYVSTLYHVKDIITYQNDKDQLSLTNPCDALHRGELAANK